MDDLDTLSNAELRAQMAAQGLPNIPVTDSSRKVLVKRLRASLGGGATGSPTSTASPKKTTSRRDTLQPSSGSVATVTTPKARRTLAVAAATKEPKELERPRITEEKTKQQQQSLPASLVPIQTRRKSSSSSEVPSVHHREVVKKQQTIVEEREPQVQTVQLEKTLEVNSLIVLESDDEEEEQLVQAAHQAEEEFQRGQKSKLTTTATKTHEYISSSQTVEPPRPRQYESISSASGTNLNPYPSRVPAPARAPLSTRAANPAAAPIASQSGLGSGSSTSYDYLNTHGGRYSSYVSTAQQSYRNPKTNPTSGTSYRHSPAAHLLPNQFSDDNEDEKDSQYESTFARNLARLRSEKIGDRSSPYSRRTVAGSSSTAADYEPRARRSLRPVGHSASVTFYNWINSLDQKYELKSKLFILIIILIFIGLYHLFY